MAEKWKREEQEVKDPCQSPPDDAALRDLIGRKEWSSAIGVCRKLLANPHVTDRAREETQESIKRIEAKAKTELHRITNRVRDGTTSREEFREWWKKNKDRFPPGMRPEPDQ